MLLSLQLPQVFSVRGLRLYFLMLEPWVAWSVSLLSCSSQFICMQILDRPLHQLPPCLVQYLPPYLPLSSSYCLAVSPLHPSFLSPPLLPTQMNVSHLTPWLSEFHTVQFSSSSCCFLFLNLLLSFFWL